MATVDRFGLFQSQIYYSNYTQERLSILLSESVFSHIQYDVHKIRSPRYYIIYVYIERYQQHFLIECIVCNRIETNPL